ncbi:MAG TPA: DUF5723 family protein [Bacteroidia bacterium]|nr:DUF5723 family protein [Bacteroidia bacterium]
MLLFTSLSRPFAQEFQGLFNQNNAGVVSVFSNPSNIVDSRMKFDMVLGGGNATFENNYIGIEKTLVMKSFSAFSIKPFQSLSNDKDSSDYFKKHINLYQSSNNFNAYSNGRIVLPTFMVNIDKKNAIALAISVRNQVNLDGMSQDLAKAAYNEFRDTSMFLKNFRSDDIHFAQMAWAEYGLTYARVISDKEKHFFKAGATFKVLQGLEATYFSVRNLQYVIDTVNVYSFISSDMSYGYSNNIDVKDSGGYSVKFKPSYGYGFDIGGVYEWRPDYQEYKYNMDGESDLWRKDQNKYKLKVAFSLNDMGGIKYNKGPYSNDVSAKFDYWDFNKLKVDGIKGFDKLMKDSFPSTSTSNSFKMSLPTTINTQVDYFIGKVYYVNFSANLPNPIKTKAIQLYDYTNISIAPRIDKAWFGLSVPVSYNSMAAQHGKNVLIGLSLRLGPLSLGTSDLTNFLGDKYVYGMNAYMLLRLPIPYVRTHDLDKDNISDRKDRCKEVPGIWEFMGCPDKDGDHVQDSEDLCPEVAGLKELQGCPDKDGDGITDLKDMCPDSAGTIEFNGCPDRDGDKIIDRVDECPDLAGLAEFKGCPDKDMDGTPDKVDACPDIFGPKEYMGCPDKDADKVLDMDDACPEQAGPLENKGCPWPDTDGDNILDKDDSCKTVAGVPQFLGCPPPPPPMKAAEKKILEKAFASLEFATGKDVILPKSFPSLNALAKLLIEHKEDWVLKLSGHTDNQGDAEKNMLLSEKRAKAVRSYLVKKGAFEEKIQAEWFGQTQPIADNNTPKGRQKNRRVEMKIVYSE